MSFLMSFFVVLSFGDMNSGTNTSCFRHSFLISVPPFRLFYCIIVTNMNILAVSISQKFSVRRKFETKMKLTASKTMTGLCFA